MPCLLLIVSLAAAAVSWRRIGFDRLFLAAMTEEDQQQVDRSVILSKAREAIGIGGFRPHIFFIEGNALEALGAYRQAEMAYTKTLGYTPYSWHARNGLGSVAVQLGHIQEGLEHGRIALSICPDYAEARATVGRALKSAGDLDGAILEYRKAVELNPDLVEAHNNLGMVLAARGNLDEAIREYRTAIERKPSLAEIHNNLGLALATRGNLDEAIREYRTAIELKPEYAKAHGNLGMALKARGDRGGAIEAFRVYLGLEADEGMRGKARELIRQLGGTP